MSETLIINMDIIEWLLKNSTAIDTNTIPSIKAWKENHDTHTRIWADPIDRAIAGGFLSDRPAYAFAAGYNTALQKLVPDLSLESLPAICVAEKQGGHPSTIKTRLEQIVRDEKTTSMWQLSGFKQFVTSARDATHFLIAASTGKDENGRNRIRLVCVESKIKGLFIEPTDKPLPFIPEIGMGTMRMENVTVKDARILPGDGYNDYIKPFRTIEDLHITGAMMGYLYRISCLFDWPHSIRERLFSLMTAVKPLSMIAPDLPYGHIVLAGVFGQMEYLMHDIDPLLNRLPEDIRSMWYRDSVILKATDNVREKRPANAWRHYA